MTKKKENPNIVFYLNYDQWRVLKELLSTLKKAGSVPDNANYSAHMLAKEVLLTFMEDMTSAKVKVEEE